MKGCWEMERLSDGGKDEGGRQEWPRVTFCEQSQHSQQRNAQTAVTSAAVFPPDLGMTSL